MSADFQFEKGLSFGEWLHGQMQEELHFETEPWALDRARRVEHRLQTGRSQAEWLSVEIPWISEVTAFTAPGRYIYVTRHLFEQCATDEEVAFIVSHEQWGAANTLEALLEIGAISLPCPGTCGGISPQSD